jgi:hypothetical protein
MAQGEVTFKVTGSYRNTNDVPVFPSPTWALCFDVGVLGLKVYGNLAIA